jgi:hypothetical protein
VAPPRIINALDSPRAAYIAGLVDGEGTITLSRTHRNEQTGARPVEADQPISQILQSEARAAYLQALPGAYAS